MAQSGPRGTLRINGIKSGTLPLALHILCSPQVLPEENKERGTTPRVLVTERFLSASSTALSQRARYCGERPYVIAEVCSNHSRPIGDDRATAVTFENLFHSDVVGKFNDAGMFDTFELSAELLVSN